ncbi:carbamoyltransferase C-terminal domain-containing protein [Candidatus Pelagibacter sp. Uisw_092]
MIPLNTSLNVKKDSTVNSSTNVIRIFYVTSLDELVFDNYLVKNKTPV